MRAKVELKDQFFTRVGILNKDNRQVQLPQKSITRTKKVKNVLGPEL